MREFGRHPQLNKNGELHHLLSIEELPRAVSVELSRDAAGKLHLTLEQRGA